MEQRRVSIKQVAAESGVLEHFGLSSMYRFHIEDPVRLNTSLKVSTEHGHANNQGNDYPFVSGTSTTKPVQHQNNKDVGDH